MDRLAQVTLWPLDGYSRWLFNTDAVPLLPFARPLPKAAQGVAPWPQLFEAINPIDGDVS